MNELFQSVVMRLALSGLAASFVVLALHSRMARDTFARLLTVWRSLTAFGRVAVCSFLLIGVLVGGDKTNGVFRTGFTGLTGFVGVGNLVNLVNPVQNNIPVQTTPPQQRFAEKKAANWNIRGAWKDSFWLPFDDGWVFPWGTNHLSGVEVVSYGEVWATPFGDAVASLSVSVEIVPGLSAFGYEHTPSNSYRFVWTDAAINRDTNNLVTASIELFRNGDTCVTTNGVTIFSERELPFAHDGYGQDAEWGAANFTNATEILAVGYPQWVDAQVGTGLTNGLYKLTVNVADNPPETTQVSVGNLSVAVTNAGEYVFLLEKGPAYDLAVFPPSSNVTISAVDDIVATCGAALRGGFVETALPARSGDVGTWMPDGGGFWTDYAAGMGHARLWWLPWLCGSPDVTHIGPNDEVTFTAILGDCRRADGAAFHWTVSEGLSLTTPNAQSTVVSADSMPSWASANASVTASFGDRSLTSYLDLSYGTNSTPQVHLSLNVPDAVLLNSNVVSAAKVAAAGWSFWSDAPTSGVVRVSCLSGADKVLSPELVGEWAVSDSYSVAATLEGIGTSAVLDDVVFRMEFCGGDATNTVEKATTVVRVGDVLLPSAPADGLVVLTNTPVAMMLDCEPAGAGSFLSTTWHTRRLKSDGTYAEWQIAAYGRPDASFVFTPAFGGIYQLRALAGVEAGGADERFYVWDADEVRIIGPRTKGELKSLGVVSHTWQQTLRNCALGHLGSTAYLSTAALPAQYGFPAYPAGDVVFKCNIFVAHRIVQSGLLCPKTRGWFNSYPPLANDWANPSYEIGDWVLMPSEEYPEPGYVAADPDLDTSGHMGILDFDGCGISAGMSNVNRHFDTGSLNIVRRKWRIDPL